MMSLSTPLSSHLFHTRSRVPVILQSEAAECGLACMAMIAQYYSDKRDLNTLRQSISVSLRGTTLKDVMRIASELGFQPRAVKIEMEHLVQLSCPAILHWDMNHFVVLTKVKGKHIFIHDPALGKRKLNLAEASKYITGIALEVSPSDTFSPKKSAPRLGLTQFFSRAIGFKRNLLTLFALSIVLQLFALAAPYYMQTVVDDVLIYNNDALLKALAIGFALLLVIETFTSGIRKFVILSVSSRLQLQMSASVFKHLLALPLDYFDKRHIGDVVSRFGSVASIREFLTTGVVTAMLDGVMAIVTLAVMSLYSFKLTMVVVVIMLVYLAIRLGLLPFIKRLTTERIALAASEQSHFMESVRAILPIRVYGQEIQRHSLWQNKLVATLNKDITLGKFNIGSALANQLLFGVENLVVVYIGANLVMQGSLSIGMLLAFMAYKTRFVGALDGIVNKLIELNMLGVHFNRLSDILLTPVEQKIKTHPLYSAERSLPVQNTHASNRSASNSDSSSTPLFNLPDAVLPENSALDDSTLPDATALRVRSLSYRYGENGEWVFNNLTLSVNTGEIVAIIGSSGSGKSTLLKCLMGLYRPSQGCIEHPNTTSPVIASVLQEDACLSGTIGQNICCFEEVPNLKKMVYVAQLACIHRDIMHMPMQYHSLVGDMGSSLSGGQKQRLLLARALYQEPDILFLDEASSHLDMANEAQINHHLKSLNMTRIIVAHRPQSIAMADKVYRLEDGTLHPCSPSEVTGSATSAKHGETL
ncbi:peptidase domain-containing ABC transporter [Alteromonas sp. BL110]|uniref:peptidase domain-containing ABC transporter n=1 Tax=Alteromonas sp. BL110 TaxID=1714845 RepID=UPI000E49DE70|nr:peptidase domain-containing ABC transporter [Alteromonas sp. BL110]AXT38952.1 peptidase domain-containing ABC transporter [Alteromonas sp. BL110]RKM84284.1 ATP-binding cassette domain-containing protein [Alteromonas sp. BL110]